MNRRSFTHQLNSRVKQRNFRGVLNRRAALLMGLSAVLTAGVGVHSVFAAPTQALAPLAQSVRGEWSLQIDRRGALLLEVMFPLAGNSVTGSIYRIESRIATSKSVPALKRHHSFRPQSIYVLPLNSYEASFSRDAGAFTLLGFDWRRRVGDVVFIPNAVFAGRLRETGILLGNYQLLTVALANATVSDVELLRSAFPNADVTVLAFLKMSNQQVQDVVVLKEFFPAMTVQDLMDFIVAHVTPSYVLSLQQSGLRGLTPSDVSDLKIARIDADFVRKSAIDGVIPNVRALLSAKRFAKNHTI